MDTKFDTMEFGNLLCKISDLQHGSFKRYTNPTYLEKAIVESQCNWTVLKTMSNIKGTYPGLFCPYEDLPLYINGTDEEDALILKWRLDLGK